MPRITIVHADDCFKVFKNAEQIPVPTSTGKTLPVELEARGSGRGRQLA